MAALTRLGVGGSAAAYKFEPAAVIILDATKASVSATGKQAELLTGELFDNAIKASIVAIGRTGSLRSYADNAIKASIVATGRTGSLRSYADNATKASVVATGKTGSLRSYADNATKQAVSIAGISSELMDGAVFDIAVREIINIFGKSAHAPGSAYSAASGSIHIIAKSAELVTSGAIYMATSGNVSVTGIAGELVDGAAEILDAITGLVVISGKAALSIADTINAISGSVIISGNPASVEWYVFDSSSGYVSIVSVPAWANEQAEILEAVKANLSISGNQAIMADSKIIILPRSRMLIITKPSRQSWIKRRLP